MTARIKPALKILKNQFEKAAWDANQLICGIDEVGRGCLAGPLVTAAVILPPYTTYRLLKDSKIMTEEERLKAYAWITKNAWYGVGIVHHRIIDKHNIWQATLIAMKRAFLHALASCPHTPSALIIDAMPLRLNDTSFANIPVHSFPKGESKSYSIAAASIVAKVRRDALMERLDPLFPGYHLASHKGYATQQHRDSLIVQHRSLIHRCSFLDNLTTHKEPDRGGQQTLC